MKKLWQGLRVFGFFTQWAAKAMEDGKITLEELVELAHGIGEIFGMKLVIELPEELTLPDLPVSGGVIPGKFDDSS